MRLLLASLLILGASNFALAQSDDEGSVIAELKKRIEQLEDENAKLQSTVAKQHQLQDQSQRELDKIRQNLLMEQEHAHKLAQLHSTLQAEHQSHELAMVERAAQLQDELKQLMLEEEARRKGGELTGSLGSARSMAERLATARIENRMSMLQSKAMLQALEEFRKKEKSDSDALARLASERAKILVEQRKAEYDMLRQLIGTAKEREARVKYQAQLEMATLGVREAVLLREEARISAAQAAKGIDDRIADEALKLAVSEQMEAFLQHEMERIQQTLQSSVELDELAARRLALQNELMKVESAARQQQQDYTAERVRLEMEQKELKVRLEELAAKRSEITQKLGAQHPAVKQIDQQMEALEMHLKKLK